MSVLDGSARSSRATGKVGLAAILAALSMISPFSIDTFFPSLRAMQSDFGVDSLTIQQLLTAYMVPYAAMSLVHGALSDAVGRRAVVLGGLAVYLFASLGCVMAPGFGTVLAFRVAQGLTAGVGITVGRAVIRDLYEGRDAQRLMSLVTMIFGIAPAIAPVIGGWVHIALGWRGVFGFLGLLSATLLLLSHLYLPETHTPEKRTALQPLELARAAVNIITDRRFLWLACCNSALFATLWIFIGSAPAIVMEVWHLSETQFGALFFPIIFGYITGALCSGKLAGRMRTDRQLKASIAITIIAGALGSATNLALAPAPMLVQQFAMALTAFGVQLGTPILTLRGLDLYPAARGSASSLLAFVQLAGASFVLAFTPLMQHSLTVISMCSLGAALLAAACARLATGRRSRGTDK